MFALDFVKHANGNLYLLTSGYSNVGSGGYVNDLICLASNGNVVWQNFNTTNYTPPVYTTGSLAVNSLGEVYTITVASQQFLYEKTSSDGKTLWSITEPVRYYNPDDSQPAHVFLKENETPVFLSTNGLPNTTRDYFFQERDKDTGAIRYVEYFDGGFDNPTIYDDALVAFYKVPGKDEFVVTGTVAGKMPLTSLTIATLKYGVESLKADFTASKTQIISGQSVNFINHSTGLLQSIAWSFPGGQPSTFTGSNPPPIVYTNPGKYSVSLQVQDAFSSDTRTVTDNINVFEKLKADFVVPDTIVTGHGVNFENTSSGQVDSYQWSFAGGTPTTSNDQTPQGVIFQQGTFLVSLIISNAVDSDTLKKQITVSPTAKANFTADHFVIKENQSVNFTNLSSGALQQWMWTFQSGQPSSFIGMNPPSVLYATAGKYSVSLKVQDKYGSDIKTNTAYITVYQKLTADFIAPDTVLVGQAATFADHSTGSIDSYQWVFSEGTPSTFDGKVPSDVVFSTQGIHTVTLTILNAIDVSSISKDVHALVVTEVNPQHSVLIAFPNPTDGIITIDYPREQISQVAIYNILGDHLILNAGADTRQFDISKFSSGVYLLRLTTIDNEIFAEKILKR